MTDLRYVVYIVGAALLVSIGGIILLAASTAGPIPDVLQNLAVGSLTGLVGLLVPSSTGTRRRTDAGSSELAVLLGICGVGLVVLDVFVGAGIALTVIGVMLIVAALALALLRR